MNLSPRQIIVAMATIGLLPFITTATTPRPKPRPKPITKPLTKPTASVAPLVTPPPSTASMPTFVAPLDYVRPLPDRVPALTISPLPIPASLTSQTVASPLLPIPAPTNTELSAQLDNYQQDLLESMIAQRKAIDRSNLSFVLAGWTFDVQTNNWNPPRNPSAIRGTIDYGPGGTVVVRNPNGTIMHPERARALLGMHAVDYLSPEAISPFAGIAEYNRLAAAMKSAIMGQNFLLTIEERLSNMNLAMTPSLPGRPLLLTDGFRTSWVTDPSAIRDVIMTDDGALRPLPSTLAQLNPLDPNDLEAIRTLLGRAFSREEIPAVLAQLQEQARTYTANPPPSSPSIRVDIPPRPSR